MSEIANPVRKVHQYLREAGARLSSKQFDDALAAVDAALAIDPASLPAQAMRERILETQERGGRPVVAKKESPTALNHDPASTPRARSFVPAGVDAQSWLGFEQRIQERRFNALIEQAQRALANHDSVAAGIALEEASELRPQSLEVEALSARLALLPRAVPDAVSSSDFALGTRGLGAVGLLAAGVALLLGIEWMHPTQLTEQATTAPTAAVATVPDLPRTPAPPPAATVTRSPVAPAPAQVETQADPSASDTSRAVATTGVRRAANIDRPAAGGPAAAKTFRPALVDSPVPANGGEIPDDYVAPQSGRPGYTNSGPAVAPSREPAIQTEVVAAPPLVVPATPVATPPTVVAAVAPRSAPPAVVPVSATIASTRSDETRVTQVLNQYARAYDQLDASAARAIWPTVDERALARAFAGLQSQAVSFDGCNVAVRGATATASCRGRASYVGKIGNREPRTEQREWTFELRRGSDDSWKIERAKAQRTE